MMNTSPYNKVLEFHKVYNVPIDVGFSYGLISLRKKLLFEELFEVYDELHFCDKQKLTKELADLMYVTIGCAVTFGLPLEEVFNEVHVSNLSKLGNDGKPIYREDGKVMKGPNYKEPELDKYFV